MSHQNIHRPLVLPKKKAAVPSVLLALSLLASIGTTACANGESASDTEPAASTTVPAAAAPSASAGQGQTVDAAGLTFILPAGWEREQPSSNMRAAQASIAGSGGAGELTVFFFGVGGGGSVDANLNRWVGQIQAASAAPERDQFETGEFLVTTVRHNGTLKASTMGTFPSSDQSNYGLLGAVIEGPGGPWFFKAVGPQATLDEQSTAFRTMLETVG